jgi:hypothetical protein
MFGLIITARAEPHRSASFRKRSLSKATNLIRPWERTSRFILELFPYLSSALIAAVLVPAFLYSQAHGLKAAVTPPYPEGMRMLSKSGGTMPRLPPNRLVG